MNTKKNIRISVLLMLLIAICFCGCGNKNDSAKITDNWKLVKVSVNGKENTDSNMLSGSLSPKFHSNDGKEFVFSNNGKDHKGNLTKNGDKYILDFDDTLKDMEATIVDDTLEIYLIEGTAHFYFEKE